MKQDTAPVGLALFLHDQGLLVGLRLFRQAGTHDNGSCYRDHRFTRTLIGQHIKHRFTGPYTPRTNGKAERLIQTALREWAHARTYQTSLERNEHLDPWLRDYNFHRQHASLNHNTQASRANLSRDNLLSLHI